MSFAKDKLNFDCAIHNFGIAPQNEIVRLVPDKTYWGIFPIDGNYLVGTVEPSKSNSQQFIATLYSSRDARVRDINPLKAATRAWIAHLG